MIEKVVDQHHVKMLVRNAWEDGPHPIYEIEHQGRRLAFYHPGIGSAIAAATLEEAIGLVVANSLHVVAAVSWRRILPWDSWWSYLAPFEMRALRTTIYHQPEVIANPLGVYTLVDMLKNHGIPHLVGKTWTTDGVYRETPNRIATRRSEGCWWWKWKLLA